MKLAKDVLMGRDKILRGIENLGFKSVGPVESPILSMYNQEIDIATFAITMRAMGWHFHLQRSVKKYSIPPNIHLTILPIHKMMLDEFLADAQKAVNIAKDQKILDHLLNQPLDKIFTDIKEGKIDSSLAPLILDMLEPELGDEIVKTLVVEMYK